MRGGGCEGRERVRWEGYEGEEDVRGRREMEKMRREGKSK